MHTLIMGLDISQKLKDIGSMIMKIFSFRTEVLRMHFLLVLCLFFLLVLYRRRVKFRFWPSLQICCVIAAMWFFVFMIFLRVICNWVLKGLDHLYPCMLPRKKKAFFQTSTGLVFGMDILSLSSCSCSFMRTRIWDQLSLYWGFLCSITWWFLVWSQRWEDLPSLIDFIGGLCS